MSILIFIVIAFVSATLGVQIFQFIPAADILRTVPFVAFLMPGLIMCALQLRFKLNEILEKESLYNNSERMRLELIIRKKSNAITFYIIFFLLTAVLLGISRFFLSYPRLIETISIISMTIFVESIYFFIKIILGFKEIETFKAKLESRKSIKDEKQRLLKALGENDQ